MAKNPLGTGVVEEDEEVVETSEDLQGTLKTKYESMSDLLEAYRGSPGMFATARKDIDRATGEAISAAERGGQLAAYEAQRAGAAVGQAGEEARQRDRFALGLEARRSAAKDKLSLQREEEEARRLSIEAEETARQELEEEGLETVTNAQGLAAQMIETYLPGLEGEMMWPQAFIASQELTDPKAFEAYWRMIDESYKDWEWAQRDYEFSPLQHPLVQLNMITGKPPLQGLTMATFRNLDEDGLDDAWDEWGEALQAARLPAAQNEPPVAVTPA